mmetsp:Transcript_41164/g.102401  ORF Transcript_41164/g.102401 Transcript_41164/m.102401 type:complete len:210 (+) Transcript_41164:540-1169(+)
MGSRCPTNSARPPTWTLPNERTQTPARERRSPRPHSALRRRMISRSGCGGYAHEDDTAPGHRHGGWRGVRAGSGERLARCSAEKAVGFQAPAGRRWADRHVVPRVTTDTRCDTPRSALNVNRIAARACCSCAPPALSCSRSLRCELGKTTFATIPAYELIRVPRRERTLVRSRFCNSLPADSGKKKDCLTCRTASFRVMVRVFRRKNYL